MATKITQYNGKPKGLSQVLSGFPKGKIRRSGKSGNNQRLPLSEDLLVQANNKIRKIIRTPNGMNGPRIRFNPIGI